MSNRVKIENLSSCDYVCSSGKLRVKSSSFINDESTIIAPTVGAAPVNAPDTPKDGATLVEIFSDTTRYWSFDCASGWSHVINTPICCSKTVCQWYDGLDGTSSILVLPLNMSGIINADIKDVRFIYNGVEQPYSPQISIGTALGTAYDWSVNTAGTELSLTTISNLGEIDDPCWAKICVTIEK